MEWCINRRKEGVLIFAVEKEQDLGYGSEKSERRRFVGWCINRRKEGVLIFAVEKEQDLGYGSGKK